jgi:GNAT superfamily N-acetyltransferase
MFRAHDLSRQQFAQLQPESAHWGHTASEDRAEPNDGVPKVRAFGRSDRPRRAVDLVVADSLLQDGGVKIREYQPTDVDACRRLYAQLVQHHREIYDDVTIGGEDPGTGFDEYLATPERVMTWVATDGNDIVGMTGLFWEEGESTIEPVVVDRQHRRSGVGRALIETAIAESRRRGASDVNIKPVARNGSAIEAFHTLGFRTVGHVQLFMSLDRDASYWRSGPELSGRKFDC